MKGRDHSDLWGAVERALNKKPGIFMIEKVKAHQTKEVALREGVNMVHWHMNEHADFIAKAGAREHNLSPHLVCAAKRRAKVAVVIQSMLLAIMKERSSHLDEWSKASPAVRRKDWQAFENIPERPPLPQQVPLKTIFTAEELGLGIVASAPVPPPEFTAGLRQEECNPRRTTGPRLDEEQEEEDDEPPIREEFDEYEEAFEDGYARFRNLLRKSYSKFLLGVDED